MPDPGPLGDYEPLPPPPTTGWEEPTLLAAGLAPDPAAFVEAVRAANPVLAARCLTEGRLELPEVRKQVQADLLREVGDRRVHLRARLAAGEALGTVGDPRFTEVQVAGQRVLLPPLVAVPAGTYRLGSSRWEVLRLALRGFAQARDELPRHPVDLPAYYIGRYPVTNAEYACFVAAGGYTEARYWRTAAARAWLRGEGGDAVLEEWLGLWRQLQADPEQVLAQLKRAGVTPRQLDGWRQLAQMSEGEVRAFFEKKQLQRPLDRPAYWDDARYNQPGQPVVGVTWYEARAYCAWLEGRLREVAGALTVWEGGRLSPLALPQVGCTVRLPSEAEWEAAVRGGRPRAYPGGGRWDAERANTWEGHVLRPSPVGVYPQGVNKWGVHDGAGNVWEWTRSLYQPYPYVAEDGREDPEAEGYRVLRGGSWSNNRRNARCAYRFRNVPVDVFLINIGVRVVVSLVRG